MTDRDNLVALLETFEVEFEERGLSIVCKEGGQNVNGYFGFYTEFVFDRDGAFVEMGAYE